MGISSNNQKTNSAVERALTILEYISSKTGPVGVNEIANELSLAKSTTHRLLDTLKSRGFVVQDDTIEKYDIGLKAIEVGMSGLKNWNLVDIASAYIKQLAADLSETSFLAVYDEGEIVYVYKVEGQRAVITNSQLGTRKPVHCTALGKAMMSSLHLEEVDQILNEKGMEKFTEKTIVDRQRFFEELSKIRELGYAMDDEEVEIGLTCFAAPIYSYTGKAVAGISVAGPTERMIQNKNKITEQLLEASNFISRRLGYVPAMRKSL
ncbi:IclR family transcriptional regulator [Halalkalibacter alkaliphilus]|nr:IclR family transcriptional regulator [Halalkalibacter alkaliphilus]